MSDLGKRRHHEERIKAKVRGYYVCRNRQTPKVIGRHAQTPKPCSCEMCGNPRRHFAEPTIQERRAEQQEER